ncbi:hypothetical protein Q5424_12960 [Conexibacter sp. JD483]|uniref:hypothetical protein n=1 Tax=unclassified Conexibacter TaxID=2627773 RepID=UPI002720270E|nr:MULTISPECIES: hypothetical protein [unclassified Conexibacter]MDO8187339.1 hypothetical protein [Conexibacter sp. CPCC 205706]MDO8200528.1 hypothetical protein [Conexibacter sp. CPCC 205762]MDR9370003.1 hypothetical protein [Conexibacter sp. JD483]
MHATGTLFEEPADPVGAFVDKIGVLTPEARQELDAWRAGEVVLLTCVAFAEVDAGSGRQRFTGQPSGPHAVPTHRSATADLLGFIDGSAADDLLAALGIHGIKVSRFDYYAAPHRIEVGDVVRRRLTLD